MLASSQNILEKSKTIDDKIIQLNAIIEWAVLNKNRNAYFAALYKNITKRVKEGIANKEFEDNERMYRFVIHFADYYIVAFQKFQEGKLENTNPWYKVLQLGKNKHTIMQHWLWGVNTHINYDLANTCSVIAPGEKLLSLCHDFVKINMILSSAINDIEKQIWSLSPVLSIAGKLIPKFQRAVLNFSITVARSKSWECACMQALADDALKNLVRKQSLEMTEKLTNRILNPGYIASILVFLIKITEVRNINHTIRILDK